MDSYHLDFNKRSEESHARTHSTAGILSVRTLDQKVEIIIKYFSLEIFARVTPADLLWLLSLWSPVISGLDVGCGGRVPPSPASHSTLTVISPTRTAPPQDRRRFGNQFYCETKTNNIHWYLASLLCWFAHRRGGGGDRTGSCQRKSVYCVLINLPEKGDVARSLTNPATLSLISPVLTGPPREYWGLSERHFESFFPFGFVFFFRRRRGTFTPDMTCWTFRGDLWINKEITR